MMRKIWAGDFRMGGKLIHPGSLGKVMPRLSTYLCSKYSVESARRWDDAIAVEARSEPHARERFLEQTGNVAIETLNITMIRHILHDEIPKLKFTEY